MDHLSTRLNFGPPAAAAVSEIPNTPSLLSNGLIASRFGFSPPKSSHFDTSALLSGQNTASSTPALAHSSEPNTPGKDGGSAQNNSAAVAGSYSLARLPNDSYRGEIFYDSTSLMKDVQSDNLPEEGETRQAIVARCSIIDSGDPSAHSNTSTRFMHPSSEPKRPSFCFHESKPVSSQPRCIQKSDEFSTRSAGNVSEAHEAYSFLSKFGFNAPDAQVNRLLSSSQCWNTSANQHCYCIGENESVETG